MMAYIARVRDVVRVVGSVWGIASQGRSRVADPHGRGNSVPFPFHVLNGFRSGAGLCGGLSLSILEISS